MIWQMAVGLSVNSVLILISLKSVAYGQSNDEGLYSMSDPVVILDANNSSIRDAVNGSEQMWIVFFYTDWCGHCIREAPVYKEFGRDVKGM